MFKKNLQSLVKTSIMLPALLVSTPNSGFAGSLQRTTLLEQSVHLPSNDIKTKVTRVIFPPAFKTPLHTHEGPGPRYVAKGQLKVSEKAKTGTYSAGQVFWETGEEMTVENIGSGTAEIVIFELTPSK